MMDEFAATDRRPRDLLIRIALATGTSFLALLVSMVSPFHRPLALPELLFFVLVTVALVRFYDRHRQRPAVTILAVVVLVLALGTASSAIGYHGSHHASSRCVQNCSR